MDKTVALPTGEKVPALGLGTWKMGESSSTRDAEIAAVRYAIECGYRLFDTAEMYADGGAEQMLGRALADAFRANDVDRDEVFVVSTAYPQNAGRIGVPAACDRSRKRLGLDTIDGYLLHWRGSVPIAETVDAFEAQKMQGAIREWGVSNFDIDDLIELEGIDQPTSTAKTGKLHCAANQVYYALDERGAEFGLLPYQRTLQMPTMAYCPLGRGTLAADRTLMALASSRGVTAAQVALAWVLRHADVIAIPKAVNLSHVRENIEAASIVLGDVEMETIDRAFPPPVEKTPLAMV